MPSSCGPGAGQWFILNLSDVLSSTQGPALCLGLHFILWRCYLVQFDLQGEALPGFLGIFHCVLTFPHPGVVSSVTSVFSWSWGPVDKLTFCRFFEETICINSVGRKKNIAELKDILNSQHSKKLCFLITKQKKCNLFGKNT